MDKTFSKNFRQTGIDLIKRRSKWENIESAGHKKIEQSLYLSEERFRSYIELTGQLAWTTNTKGEVEEDIPSWRKYTGQSYKEVKGSGWSKALHPDDVKHIVKVWDEAVKTKKPYEVEYRVRRYDGVYRYFLVRGVPVLGEDGQINEWVGTCIDIDERKMMERAKNDFVQLASHELRTPLSAISWAIERLYDIKCGEYSTTTKKYLNQIDEQTQKMIKLTEDLLNTTKMEMEMFSYQYERVNPVTIISEVVKDFTDQIKNKKIRFKFIPSKKISEYQTYSNAISTILSNLLSNAIKFTPNGGKINLRVTQKKDQLEFQISDSGLGIPKADQKKIFQKAYRASNARDFEGTGFGLYITKTMVDRLEGQISVQSGRKEGTVFKVILPIKKEIKKVQQIKPMDNLTNMIAIGGSLTAI